METLIRRVRAAVTGNGGVVGRYLVVSLLNVVNHQILLQIAVRWWGWGGGLANTFAAIVAVGPAYFLSRYWVWQVSGKSSVRSEVLPFWIISLAGLVISSITAEVADRISSEPLFVSVGSLGGYFLVWIAKFLLLNGLFRRADASEPDEQDAQPPAKV